ncbi:NUDIX hydrolase [Bacillus sp. SD088]|uniref:NUDIX hydrolase n=1 Tax=Bacillus sp. SD088 TaxID=2782012 RepID=UPI001A97B5AB|nr:NUDIX domain-containing protein [Bacillus sp. SD088]MBO0992754.1 NUDIX domain-containing protein [Bacillus sp. SD088]
MMSIITNKHGHQLESFMYTESEAQFQDIGSVSGGHAVLMHKNRLIVCYNKYRRNWELPGGGKEEGENLSDCVQREILEETGRKPDKLILLGVSTVYVPRIEKSIQWAVFYGEIMKISEFTANNEMSYMCEWDMVSNIGDVDEVDAHIAKIILKKINDYWGKQIDE